MSHLALNCIKDGRSQSSAAGLHRVQNWSLFHPVSIPTITLFTYSMTCQRGIARSIRSYNGCIIFDSYYIPKQFHLCFTGTGAISNLFFVFPFGTGAQPMIILTLVIFYVNLFLFCCFFIILGLKYICCSGKWSSMLRKPIRGMFPHGRYHINQYCCGCHKREAKLWRKIIPLFRLGFMVVRCFYLLCLLLGWCPRYVCFWIFSML